MSLQPDFLAKTSQPLANELELPMAQDQDCFTSLCESFAWYDQSTSYWKTSPQSLDLDSMQWGGALAEAGYDLEWACIRASDVGARHRRDRWWAVAYPVGYGSKRNLQQEVPWQSALQRVESVRGFADLRNGPSASTPRLLRGTDGLPNKLDRLRALGNAVVPHVAMIPLARVLDLHQNG